MNVTLDQARALDAFATAGTLQGAAQQLRKAHTAVLYAMKQLETQTGLELFDRGGYRTRLTPAGEQALSLCRKLLAAERELIDGCTQLHSGWEPALRVVFDAIYPAAPLLDVVRVLREEQAPTRIQVSIDSLQGVEDRFVREEAHLMISLLPPRLEGLRAVRLPKLTARLVAHKRHPLARRKGPLTREALAEHLALTVRGSDPRLGLSTAQHDQQSAVHLSDFHAKKAAILAGLGFGWLPEWIAQSELERGELVALAFEKATHVFEPRLHHRGRLGRAAQRVVDRLTPDRNSR
jgi:DNA-binding transcriptional LysR family regulator